MEAVFIILAILLLPLLIFISPIIVAVLVFRVLKRRGHRKTAHIFITGFGLVYLFAIFSAIYPSDDLYEDEFKYYTGIELPPSSDIKEKTATFPDFHGDHCLQFVVKMQPQEYDTLRSRLKQKDHAVVRTDPDTRVEGWRSLKGLDVIEKISRTMQDKYVCVTFFTDNTVFIYIAVT